MKLREQIWKADVARPIMMPAGFLRVRASESRFSGAAEALEDQARALLYVLACGDLTHQIPVQPTFLSVIDVVDVCRRKAKLRLFDQPFRLHVVFILVDVINRHLEPLAERKSQKLRIVFLEIDGADELADIHKPQFALCLIIQHGCHPSCGSNPLRGDNRGCYLSAVLLFPSPPGIARLD